MAPGADAILRRWQREAAMAARARAFICIVAIAAAAEVKALLDELRP